jgi:nitrous-oxide reductase
MRTSTFRSLRHAAFAAVAGLVLAGCGRSAGPATAADAAERVYVAPGEKDELYAFMSGGFSGQVSVYGLPSGRHFKTIKVFSQDPETGYGYSEQTRAMLNTSYGFIPWDDAHHPHLSQTAGMADGRWLFINGNNTPRIARMDLTTMETAEIIEIPNTAGNHGSPFVTENTEYTVASTRFSVPTPQRDVAISTYRENFGGALSFVKVDSATGRMALAFQIRMPGYDYDLARSGKGASHGWAFFTSYNSEQASSLLEVNASQHDKDFIAAVNWRAAEQCVAQGKSTRESARYAHNVVGDDHIARTEWITAVTVVTPATCPGMVYFLPTPKSPHGVDVSPTGEFITAGGKLAATIPVFSFAKITAAIAASAFDTTISGIPVLRYDAVLAGEVAEPGLGPLHTEFDNEGHAYTSMFLSSEIVKWDLATFQVLDRVPAYYAIGHLMVPGGDTRQPYGRYVLALNKITKDRYLPTGPELTQSAQLYDITGDRMVLLSDFPTVGEPHYAQAIPASVLESRQVRVFDLAHNTDPNAARGEAEAGIRRKGRAVHVKMTAIRSHFAPDNIEGVQLGDTVYFHITNVEQDWDVPHGFAVTGLNNSELLVMPGQTRTITWVPSRVGVFPFYCTDFCSALHQEMQGYIRVSPRGSSVALTANTSRR